jgi:hypothetical protein
MSMALTITPRRLVVILGELSSPLIPRPDGIVVSVTAVPVAAATSSKGR